MVISKILWHDFDYENFPFWPLFGLDIVKVFLKIYSTKIKLLTKNSFQIITNKTNYEKN